MSVSFERVMVDFEAATASIIKQVFVSLFNYLYKFLYHVIVVKSNQENLPDWQQSLPPIWSGRSADQCGRGAQNESMLNELYTEASFLSRGCQLCNSFSLAKTSCSRVGALPLSNVVPRCFVCSSASLEMALIGWMT